MMGATNDARRASTVNNHRFTVSFHTTPCSRIPNATADTATDGRSVKRPRVRAAKATSSTLRLNAEPTGRPITPARRNRPANESTPAMTHT